MSRLAFKTAAEEPEWAPEWIPQPRKAVGRRLGRIDSDRELVLREFLSSEVRLSNTEVERQLLTGMLQDISGTLRLIG